MENSIPDGMRLGGGAPLNPFPREREPQFCCSLFKNPNHGLQECWQSNYFSLSNIVLSLPVCRQLESDESFCVCGSLGPAPGRKGANWRQGLPLTFAIGGDFPRVAPSVLAALG